MRSTIIFIILMLLTGCSGGWSEPMDAVIVDAYHDGSWGCGSRLATYFTVNGLQGVRGRVCGLYGGAGDTISVSYKSHTGMVYHRGWHVTTPDRIQ